MASKNPRQRQKPDGNGWGRRCGLQHTTLSSDNEKYNNDGKRRPAHQKSAAVNDRGRRYDLQKSTMNTESVGKRLGVPIRPPTNNAGKTEDCRQRNHCPPHKLFLQSPSEIIYTATAPSPNGHRANQIIMATVPNTQQKITFVDGWELPAKSSKSNDKHKEKEGNDEE